MFQIFGLKLSQFIVTIDDIQEIGDIKKIVAGNERSCLFPNDARTNASVSKYNTTANLYGNNSTMGDVRVEANLPGTFAAAAHILQHNKKVFDLKGQRDGAQHPKFDCKYRNL